jgi:alpha-L-arabinofuranosidase
MTWGQPPFYSHQMIHQSWQPNAVAVSTNATTTGTSFVCPETLRDQQNGWWHESDAQRADGGSDGSPGGSCSGAVTAQVSDDGKTLVVRFVNMGVGPVVLDLQIAPRTASAAELRVLHSDKLTAVNTPAQPRAVVPTTVKMSAGTKFSTLSAVPVPPQAFAIVQATLV